MRPVQRILYVRTDRMGDVLMNLPALRLLRQEYPKAWLTLLVDASVSALFDPHPDVDEVMAVEASALKRDRRARQVLTKKISGVRYDLMVVSNPDRFFHWLGFFSRIPLRVGWRRKCAFFLNYSLRDDKATARRHEIDSNLLLAGLVCRQKWDGRLRLGKDAQAEENIKKLLVAHSERPVFVAVHASSSNPAKKWPLEHFVEVGRCIQNERNHVPVLIGGQEECGEAAELAHRIGGNVLDLCGRLSLKELGSFFSHPDVRALVSADSGPVHVAWISGKPVVALYAKNVSGSDPKRWGPRNERSEVIFAPIQDVRVEEVWEKLKKVLSYAQ